MDQSSSKLDSHDNSKQDSLLSNDISPNKNNNPLLSYAQKKSDDDKNKKSEIKEIPDQEAEHIPDRRSPAKKNTFFVQQ